MDIVRIPYHCVEYVVSICRLFQNKYIAERYSLNNSIMQTKFLRFNWL